MKYLWFLALLSCAAAATAEPTTATDTWEALRSRLYRRRRT